MQFLSLIETIAANLTNGNVTQFITLTENLITLAEAMLPHQAAAQAAEPTTTPAKK